jgi:archaellum component FlaC
MGKKINFHVDGCSDGKTNVGLDFYTTQFIYSKSTPPPPEPTIIEEILKSIKLINVELGKINTKIDNMDAKIDNMDERITNIEQVQKVQGEKLDKIDERLTKLENKVDNVIVLNNLKT